MAIANSEPRQISPTHPGEMLREDFMADYGLTATALAAALGVSRQTIHELLSEQRAVTPLMALRLSRLFGNPPETSIFILSFVPVPALAVSQAGYQKAVPVVGDRAARAWSGTLWPRLHRGRPHPR